MGELTVRSSAPAAPPLPPQTTETKAASQAHSPAQNQTSPRVEVNQEHAAQKKNEQSITGVIKQKDLNQQLSIQKAEASGSAPTAVNLPKKATVRSVSFTRSEYNFGRPITKEQAAHIIFKDGKIPDGAKLEQGADPNTWTLRMAEHAHESILGKMRSHYETPTGNAYEAVFEWPDVPIPPSEATTNKRWDLHNDFGFKITGKYALDEGQQQVKYVTSGLGTGKGQGFELDFEKPMTKQQVMDKLFDQSKLPKGAVKLIPVPFEPASSWRVEIIAADAHEAFNPRIMRAFGSATTHGKEVSRPGIPPGIQSHLSNKTVPNNAVKHPPNVYVWEQEGHLVRVEKGNGHYSHEITKLHPGDQKGNDTIRYFMKDLGMKPREAWQAYVKHWDDIHRGIITAYAIAMSGGRMPGKAPVSRVNVKPQRPSVNDGKPPARVPQQEIPVNTNGTTLNTKAPTVNTNVRVKQPGKAPVDPHANTSVDPNAKTQPANSPGGVKTNGTTVDTNSPPRKSPPVSKGSINGMRIYRQLPDNQKITIQTSDGPKQMTVGEYRKQYRLAEKWRTDQIVFNKRNPNDSNLDLEAAKKFGLDKSWQRLNNPYIYGVR